MIAIVDAGPLYATADQDEEDHERSLDILARTDLQLIIPTLVIAEVVYFIGRRLGASAELAFLEGLSDFTIESTGPALLNWFVNIETFRWAQSTHPSSPSRNASTPA